MNNTNCRIAQLLLGLEDQRSKKFLPGAKAVCQGGNSEISP